MWVNYFNMKQSLVRKLYKSLQNWKSDEEYFSNTRFKVGDQAECWIFKIKSIKAKLEQLN